MCSHYQPHFVYLHIQTVSRLISGSLDCIKTTRNVSFANHRIRSGFEMRFKSNSYRCVSVEILRLFVSDIETQQGRQIQNDRSTAERTSRSHAATGGGVRTTPQRTTVCALKEAVCLLTWLTCHREVTIATYADVLVMSGPQIWSDHLQKHCKWSDLTRETKSAVWTNSLGYLPPRLSFQSCRWHYL